MAIITLTTDFGLDDGYAGAMKGAILSINPQAAIVDITHLAPPQDVFHGAFALWAAYALFPRGTVHVAVVDPGVGGARRGIAVSGGGYLFVGPDNGVLSLALEGAADTGGRSGDPLVAVERPLPPGYAAVEATNPRFHRPEVSSTFHGRDVFGPVAAHLSLGVPLEHLGPRVETIFQFPASRPSVGAEGTVRGAVLHVDRFGNLLTNIRPAHLPGRHVRVRAGRAVINGLSDTYSAGEGVMALWGSNGTLEIAVKNDSAARILGLRRGDPVLAEVVAQ